MASGETTACRITRSVSVPRFCEIALIRIGDPSRREIVGSGQCLFIQVWASCPLPCSTSSPAARRISHFSEASRRSDGESIVPRCPGHPDALLLQNKRNHSSSGYNKRFCNYASNLAHCVGIVGPQINQREHNTHYNLERVASNYRLRCTKRCTLSVVTLIASYHRQRFREIPSGGVTFNKEPSCCDEIVRNNSPGDTLDRLEISKFETSSSSS